MFRRSISQFLTVLTTSLALSSIVQGAYDPLDARHQLVSKVRETFGTEIAARKARLGTYYGAIALIDMANERLEAGVFKPTEPDWAAVIHFVSLGYGYSQGLVNSASLTGAEKPTESDFNIMKKGYALSSSYLRASLDGYTIVVNKAYTQATPTAVIANHLSILNQTAALVPEKVHTAVQDVVSHVRGLSQLSRFNAWFSHERFWAAGGVIDPQTYGSLKASHAAFRGTSLGFLSDLTVKLDTAMRALPGVPGAEAIENLVRMSQQILLTIAAGTPSGETHVRLSPSSAADWQIIRKALFLALSVTSDPEKSGRAFLTPTYNLSQYYHNKTDAAAIKEYYWKLEAYGIGFSAFWKGLKAGQADSTIQAQLNEKAAMMSDPLNWFIKPSVTYNRPAINATYNGAYRSSIGAISLPVARAELAVALTLHSRLNYQQAFRTLYPDLTEWAEHHTPSQRAQDLVGSTRTKITPPAGFQSIKMSLIYAAGKWSLKGINGTQERTLWTQGYSSTAQFIGSLEDARGTHLFSFSVNGATATIKSISCGYTLTAGGAGSTVSVADGDNLGLIESSAYPEDTDTENNEDGAIIIRGARYSGMRGILSSARSSVLVTAPDIIFRYAKGFEEKTHKNGKKYNFLVQKGQGIQSHKDIILIGNEVQLDHSVFRAGQSMISWNLPGAASKLATYGSSLHASYVYLTHSTWHTDTPLTYAGMPQHDPYVGGEVAPTILNQMRTALTTTSYQAHIESSRWTSYFASQLYILDDKEYTDLLAGSHTWGSYETKQNLKTPITMYIVPQEPAYDHRSYYGRDGGFGGLFGGGGGNRGGRHQGSTSSWSPQFTSNAMQRFNESGAPKFVAPSSFGNFFQPGGNLPNVGVHVSLASMAASMLPQGLTQQSFDVGLSNGGGNSTMSAAINMQSQFEQWSTCASYSSGVYGRSLDLSSAYSGSGDNASMLSAAHALTGAGIMQLTAAYNGKMSMDAINASGLSASGMAGFLRVPPVVKGILFLEDYRRRGLEYANKLAEDKSKATADPKGKSASKSATGGPKGQLPEGGDSKEKHFEVPQSQQELNNFIERADRSGSGLKADPFHRASSFGTQGTTNINVQKIIGGDGRPYVRLIKEAIVNDQPGFFEYLVDSTGKITHQLFKVL